MIIEPRPVYGANSPPNEKSNAVYRRRLLTVHGWVKAPTAGACERCGEVYRAGEPVYAGGERAWCCGPRLACGREPE